MKTKCYNNLCNDHDDKNNKCNDLGCINIDGGLDELVEEMRLKCEKRKKFNRILRAQYRSIKELDTPALYIGWKFLEEYEKDK